MTRFVAPFLISALVMTLAPHAASAQTDAEKTVPAATNPQTITIELREAPIRKALERLFDAVKADFVLEGAIKAGTVTARIKDKPFETVLKVILDSSTVPLTYEREGNVYIISVKPTPPPAPEPVKVATAEETPAESTAGENTGTLEEAPVRYSAPAYWTLPAPTGWQLGPVRNLGVSPLNIGAPGWPVFPANAIFWNPQPGWGGFGGGFRFP